MRISETSGKTLRAFELNFELNTTPSHISVVGQSICNRHLTGNEEIPSMKDLITMWKNKKMVAAVGLTAATYFASLVLIPDFLIVPRIGILRIGIAIPIVFSFFFGPAAAWGAGFANVLGDLAKGQFDSSSLFGFIGNFAVGYIPYRFWRSLTRSNADMMTATKIILFVYIAVLVNVVAGDVIGWGVGWLFGASFAVVAISIALSNSFWAVTVGSVLQAVVYRYFRAQYPFYADKVNPKTPVLGTAIGSTGDSQAGNRVTVSPESRLSGRVRFTGVLGLSLSAFGCLAFGVLLHGTIPELVPLLIAMMIFVNMI